MRRDEIIASLKRAEPALREAGVDALQSDERFGFLQYMDAYETIQKALGGSVAVGYSTRNGLSRYVRPEIEKEAIRVF
jgi:uncharacterized protein